MWLVWGAIGLVALSFVPTFWLGAGSLTVFSNVCWVLGALCALSWLGLILYNTVRGK